MFWCIMNESTIFGQWLRNRREAFDLSREALAERVHCSPETIRKIEAGTRRPSRQMLEPLAGALEAPPQEIPARVGFARLAPRPAAPGGAGEARGPIRAPPRPPHPGQLPVARTTFVGRAREIDTICACIEQP